MKNMSIKASILIPILAVLIVGIVMMVFIVGSVSSSTASELTEDLVYATVNEYSNKFEALCMEAYGLSESLASVLEGIPSSSNNPREEAISAMTSILHADDSIISIWTCWEPNAFDGRDSEYAGADDQHATGRFTTYVCKEGDSYIAGIVEDFNEGDFYQGPRLSGKPYITDPYECVFDGETIPVYTISMPIMKNGSFAGAVGIDISLSTVNSIINSEAILNDGYVFLLSPGGYFSAHRNNDLMLQSYDTTWLKDYSSEISTLQENGDSFTARGYSDQLNSNIRLLAIGVSIGETGRYWTVCGVATEADISASSNKMIMIVTVIGCALILVAGLTVFFIVNNRLKKLPAITAEAEAMAKGEISLTDKNISSEKTKNEISLLERAFAVMARGIHRQSDTLLQLAEGDYSVSIPVRSDADVMNKAINNMIDSTNEVMNEIRMSSIQVSAGSKHISDGAQALAQGATEQAAAIEELSASMSEISDITNQNANIAREAADLSGVIRSNAEKGSGQMERMMQAVMEINEASSQIGKVIKVIEDIAFQTNVLALNASVEAARAGQHGKGFAVVAEEVGNLAAESSEAAKDTGALIENSIEKANLGLNIATETSESLQEMVSGVNQSAHIVEQIAQSCDEQSAAIKQINTGVDQVAQVIQQNSATAEESAAASEEMSGQSNMLKQMIARFKLKNTDYSSSFDDESF